MILNALHDLAVRENLVGDPDFETKPVSWVIELRPDGTLIQIGDVRANANEGKMGKGGKPLKPKWVGKAMEVPLQPGRTSGDRAFFLVDKAEYALGLDPAGTRPSDKLAARLGLFLDPIRRCAQETGDSVAAAVAVFLNARLDGANGDVVRAKFPEEAAANDLFAFRVGGEFAHARTVARDWFREHYGRKPMKATKNGARCLVTGEPAGKPSLFPLIKRVPGGTPSGNALVSFNVSAYESYGLSGNANAPVSQSASQQAAAALNRLLDYDAPGGLRRLNLSGDTAVVHWSTKHCDEAATFLDALNTSFSDEPQRVPEAFQSLFTGRPPEIGEDAPFYALTLSGTQGRVIVRDWFESTLKAVLANLARHFADVDVVRLTRPAKGKPDLPAIPLRRALDALAAPGREASVPAALAGLIWRAALKHEDYPASLLPRILLRERAEAGGDEWIDSARRDARVSLLKGLLIRRFNLQVEKTMNDDNTNAGYLLGRLLAVLEDTQRLALGKGLNATIKDKFYGSASATPAAVFPQLMDLFHKHARKARDSRPGAVVNREKLVDAILAKLDPNAGIPVHLPLPDQGMFVLGYHQQRHALFNKPEQIKETTDE